MWHLTPDMWHVTYDTWFGIFDNQIFFDALYNLPGSIDLKKKETYLFMTKTLALSLT